MKGATKTTKKKGKLLVQLSDETQSRKGTMHYKNGGSFEGNYKKGKKEG